MDLIAVVLAGGEGRRMGGADKALLSLSGQPLLAHLLQRLRPQVSHIVISANGEAQRFAPFGLPVLADGESRGPLSGILAALLYARRAGAEAVLSVPVDAPFVPPDLVAGLSAAWPLPAWARAGGRDHNATALWPVSLAGPLEAFLASGVKARISDFALAHQAVALDFPDAAAFDNINRPEDLARAALRLSGGRE